jgi:hypothetical protein
MRLLQIPCHLFRLLADPDWISQFITARQRRLILAADRRYALIRKRYSTFSSTQLFTASEKSRK